MQHLCPTCQVVWSDDIVFCPHDGTPLGTGDPARAHTAPAALAPAGEVAVGDDLGPYHLVERLGAGGMGSVFRARHKELGREVAIKVLHREVAADREAVQRFFREARVVNLIQHPHIVEVTDFVIDDDGQPYMVMQLLHGESLEAYANRHAPLTASRAIAIVTQIARAMAEMHAVGVVHRDLKPENILLTDNVRGELTVKLIDFGIAKFLGTDETLVKTATGMIFGTPEYMAPEQIQGLPVDSRTDIYSLGVILFLLLTGRLPFEENSLQLLLVAHVAQDPPRVSELAPGHPPMLDTLVARCLAKHAQDRFASMWDLVNALERIRSDDATVVVDPPREPTPAGAGRSSRRRRLWSALGLGLVLAVVIAALGGVFSKRQPTSRRVTPPPAATPPPGPPAAWTEVVLVSSPVEARVYSRDGRLLGRTPRRVRIPIRGSTEIVLRSAGYRPENVVVTPDDLSPREVALRAIAPPPPTTAAAVPVRTPRQHPRPRARRRLTARPRPAPRPRARPRHPTRASSSGGEDLLTVDPFGMNR